MRMDNLHGTEKEQEDEESSDEESDEEEDEDKKPLMELAMLPHYGGINRVRVRCLRIPVRQEGSPGVRVHTHKERFNIIFDFL